MARPDGRPLFMAKMPAFTSNTNCRTPTSALSARPASSARRSIATPVAWRSRPRAHIATIPAKASALRSRPANPINALRGAPPRAPARSTHATAAMASHAARSRERAAATNASAPDGNAIRISASRGVQLGKAIVAPNAITRRNASAATRASETVTPRRSRYEWEIGGTLCPASVSSVELTLFIRVLQSTGDRGGDAKRGPACAGPRFGIARQWTIRCTPRSAG